MLPSLTNGSGQVPGSPGRRRSTSASKQRRLTTGSTLRTPKMRSGPTVSTPVVLMIVFPCLVIVAIAFLFTRHSSKLQVPPTHAGRPGVTRRISEKHDKVFVKGCQPIANTGPRANATFVMLARNDDLQGVIRSVISLERHFNRWFHYPYVLLNDDLFNATFRREVERHASGTVTFGQIDPDMWGFPDSVEPAHAREAMARQGDQAVMYGGLESYHHMCRFFSGFFYKHELLKPYEWYWRVEPDVKFFCDITYDPFVQMAKHKKVYGFTIAVKELKETVPNIFRYASAYMRTQHVKAKSLWQMFISRPEEDPSFLPAKDPRYNLMQEKQRMRGPGEYPFIDNETMEGEVYNRCHFWSNFEIARLDFFRSPEYEAFFQTMDRSGGFFSERWGDAPIHSLAAGILLAPSQVHYFRDIGYRHSTIQHCPGNTPGRQIPLDPYYDESIEDESARKIDGLHWMRPDPPGENGVGCRCRCDIDLVEVEGKDGSCIAEWVDTIGGWTSPKILYDDQDG